jgi:hypothetical protein
MKQWQIPTSNVVSYKTIATGAIVHAARNRSKRTKRHKAIPANTKSPPHFELDI